MSVRKYFKCCGGHGQVNIHFWLHIKGGRIFSEIRYMFKLKTFYCKGRAVVEFEINRAYRMILVHQLPASQVVYLFSVSRYHWSDSTWLIARPLHKFVGLSRNAVYCALHLASDVKKLGRLSQHLQKYHFKTIS